MGWGRGGSAWFLLGAPLRLIDAANILRQFRQVRCLECLVGFDQLIERGRLEEVEAQSGVDDRTNHCRIIDAPLADAWICRCLFGEIERPLRAVLPKIDAMPKPVVTVLAGREVALTSQNPLSDLAVCAVKA